MDTTRFSARASYSDLFDRMLDPVFLVDDLSLEILDANPAAETLIGATSEILVGQSLSTLVDAANREEFEKYVRMCKRSYYPKKFKTIFKSGNQKNLHVELLLCTLRLQDGKTEVVQVIARDVTSDVVREQQVDEYLRHLVDLNNKLEMLATHDELTKLVNARHFRNALRIEHERASRAKDQYALIFCDGDHFKNYNDRNGHVAGDGLLRDLAGCIQSQVRISDLACRYGGEEFVVLCRSTSLDGAKILAERLREKVESFPFPHGAAQPIGKVTMSIGVAVFPEHGETPEDILERADAAMYQSKHAGRNRVTIA